MTWGLFSGAGDGTRTRDLLVGNEKLYQLSYSCLSAVNGDNYDESRHIVKSLAKKIERK